MSHLNFNVRAVEIHRQSKSFDPPAKVSSSGSSVLWMAFAVAAVASTTFAIVWFA